MEAARIVLVVMLGFSGLLALLIGLLVLLVFMLATPLLGFQTVLGRKRYLQG